MSVGLEDFQKFGKEHFEAVNTAASAFAKNVQAIATEASDYSKRSIDHSSAFFEKLLGAKTLDTAIQIQSEFAKTSYAGFVAQATKFGELYTALAKEAFQPLEKVIAKVQSRAE
ncbi:phasin family protein [Beijerinckia mobilis]|uniref:phasin family protein n=1 Tax=Beijerinckia mobilis TaxID=231434 RepID=UPI000555A3B2|nr:phasin family protein [Beijerinckia mobilis]